MSTATGQVESQSFHDYVVDLVAQRWANTMRCKVTVNTPSQSSASKTEERKYPDLVGWQLHAERNTVEWIAEVETEESFSELDAHGRWQDYTALGMQFYLFVPKGCGAIAQSFALRAGVQINRIFEYSFEQDTFQLS
jgi:hypothetical protein